MAAAYRILSCAIKLSICLMLATKILTTTSTTDPMLQGSLKPEIESYVWVVQIETIPENDTWPIEGES